MKINTPAILLSVLLASCTSESTDITLADAQPYSDGSFRDVHGLLSTGDAKDNVENSWFCTLSEQGQFVDRSQWHLWLDGAATLDGLEAEWSFENNQLAIQAAQTLTVYNDPIFSMRIYDADIFSAITDDGKLLECDWSGPPREGQFFNDGQLSTNIEELTQDTIDVLLTSGRVGNDQTSYWMCQDIEKTGSTFLLYLLDDGSNMTSMEGRWSRIDSSSMQLDIDGVTEVWQQINISEYGGEQFGRFSALRADQSSVECLWTGESRSSAWSPN